VSAYRNIAAHPGARVPTNGITSHEAHLSDGNIIEQLLANVVPLVVLYEFVIRQQWGVGNALAMLLPSIRIKSSAGGSLSGAFSGDKLLLEQPDIGAYSADAAGLLEFRNGYEQGRREEQQIAHGSNGTTQCLQD
jgi:hypothetical protein